MRQRLTMRQAQIVNMASEGLTDAEIARILNLSVNSVRCRWRKAFAALGTTDRASTVAMAIRRGEIL